MNVSIKWLYGISPGNVTEEPEEQALYPIECMYLTAKKAPSKLIKSLLPKSETDVNATYHLIV